MFHGLATVPVLGAGISRYSGIQQYNFREDLLFLISRVEEIFKSIPKILPFLHGYFRG